MQENQTTENTQDPNNVPKKTDVQFIEQLKNIYREIATLDEDLKAVKEDAKDAGYNPALLSKVAKALSEFKANEIIEKNQLFEKLVEKVEGGENNE